MSSEKTSLMDQIEREGARLHAFTRRSHDGVAVLDQTGIIRYFSPASGRQADRAPEEVIGHHISEFIHPKDLPKILERLWPRSSRTNPGPLVYRTLRPDGRWRWFEAVMPCTGGHFVPDHYIFFIRDITPHRRLEMQYRMAERITNCGVWRVDLDSPYPDLSPGMFRLFGPPPKSSRSRKYWPLSRLHPSDTKAVLKKLREVIHSPHDFTFRCRVRTPQGAVRLVRTCGHVETDASGKAVAIMGVSQDISLISAAHQKLRDSEQKYRLLTEQSTDIICHLSVRGTIEFISPAVQRLIGRSPNRLLGLNFRKLMAKEYYEDFDRFLTLLRQGQKDVFCTVRAECCYGHDVWLELTGRVITHSDGTVGGIVCTARDITERKKFECDLEAARRRAEEASATKSRFLSNVSHELRTPLNAIMGFSEIIREQTFGAGGDSRYAEYAGLIHESGSILQSLVNDLLDLSKIDAGKYELHPETLQLGDVVPACVRQIKPQAMKKRIVIKDCMSGMNIRVEADKGALMQILINLLSNAVKFTPEGGRIELRVHEGHKCVRLEVHDTGVGIKPEDIERITAPFEQVTERSVSGEKGTGLGLALAKSLTELHGGRLVIKSEPGKGTVVSVELPIRTVRDAAA